MNNTIEKAYPRVTIVIVNWNGLKDTEECLESLKKITYPNYNVIVVDNGSTDDDALILNQKFSEYIHIIQNNKNDGYAAGANIGTKYALANFAPDYICLLNNDTIVDPLFLTEMVKVAETDIDIGIIGCKIYYYSEPNRLQAVWGKVDMLRGEAIHIPSMEPGKKEIDLGQYDSIETVDWVTGCCTLVKRSVIDTVGFFDERYFCYWEDVDYCFRARESGFKILYVPTAKIWHKLGQSSNKVSQITVYYWRRNQFLFMKRHATKFQYFVFLAHVGLYCCLAPLYYIAHFRLGPLLKIYSAIWDGARGRGGVKR